MAKIWEGKPSAPGMRFAVVMSRFNSGVTDKLLGGALEALKRAQVAAEDIEVVRVALDTGVPVTNAVLTTETLEQAVARSTGRGSGNKGYDAALAAVETAVLHRALAGGGTNGRD